MRGRSADRLAGQSDPLLHRLHRRSPREHAGDLRGATILEDANGDQHVHRELGYSRRVFPHRDTLPGDHNEPAQLDIRQDHV